MKKGLITIPLMITFIWSAHARLPRMQDETFKKVASSKQSDHLSSLKKAQKNALKTIEHPLVYGPPLVIAIGGVLTLKSAIGKPEVILFLILCGMGFTNLVGNNEGKIELERIVGLAAVPLLVYGGCCFYVLKKAFDSEREQKKEA